jgi:RNA polymerase sigma-70 factor (ECF subfamily)
MPRCATRCRRSAPDLGDVTIAGEDAFRAAEHAAREHYSRVLASLAAQFRDVAAAEDALAESLVAALTQWPQSGVPDNPAAWLLTVARRRLSDRLRRHATAQAALEHLIGETCSGESQSSMIDRRLELLFACAHPAIEETVRAPLMLQVVFGLDAGIIAGLFLMSPGAMAQRLVRAKQKIRDARIPFQLPEPEDYGERLAFVLAAIYALFTRDGAVWHEPTGNRESLADEAIWLGHLVVGLSRRHPEALGLMALMLFAESRRNARRCGEGRYVPLSEQPPSLWDAAMIGRAENLLREAARKQIPGRYQLEAAIQSVHAARAQTGATDWPAILSLYDGLIALGPSLVPRINRAVAVLHVHGAPAALAALDELAADPRIAAYQPYWAARAHILVVLGRTDDATMCYDRAIALEGDEVVKAFLKQKMQSLINASI